MKLFAGPCSLESKELCFEVAKTIRDNLPSDIDYFFKIVSAFIADEYLSKINKKNIDIFLNLKN